MVKFYEYVILKCILLCKEKGGGNYLISSTLIPLHYVELQSKICHFN